MECTNVDFEDFYNYETYAIVLNGDRSLLLLNPWLEVKGYAFVAVSFPDFQSEFSYVLNLPMSYNPKAHLKLKGEIYVGDKFDELLLLNKDFGYKVALDKEVILLKRIEISTIQGDDPIFMLRATDTMNAEIGTFSKHLVEQLRLFKSGDIAIPLIFQIDIDTRRVGVSQSFQSNYGHVQYSVNQDEVELLSAFLEKDFIPNKLTHLAVRTFNQCYEIGFLKIRFIMLMVCLESLMNQGKDQIVHTISRHTALVLSKSDREFHQFYKRIKELYGYRSKIVHGSSIKENTFNLTMELEGYVRSVINYCLQYNGTKDELFADFNRKGFA